MSEHYCHMVSFDFSGTVFTSHFFLWQAFTMYTRSLLARKGQISHPAGRYRRINPDNWMQTHCEGSASRGLEGGFSSWSGPFEYELMPMLALCWSGRQRSATLEAGSKRWWASGQNKLLAPLQWLPAHVWKCWEKTQNSGLWSQQHNPVSAYWFLIFMSLCRSPDLIAIISDRQLLVALFLSPVHSLHSYTTF